MWRSREEGRGGSSRWGEQHDSRWGESRPRSPVWEVHSERSSRSSPQRDRHHRERYDRDRHDRDRRDRDNGDRDRDRRDRYDRDTDRHRDSERTDRDGDRFGRNRDRNKSRESERDRERDRERRKSPRRHSDEDIPSAPSPPKISTERDRERERKSRSRSRSVSRERQDGIFDNHIASPGDWFCKCGSYNFKRRQTCYRRNCQGTKAEGVIYGGDSDPSDSKAGISKQLLFKRLDALTTEERILEVLKERCTKSLIDSITGITIGRETLTGASKCLAYVNFSSVTDSSAAYSELNGLKPPLEIDSREVLVRFYTEPQKQKATTSAEYANYYAQMASYGTTTQAISEADRVNAAAAVAQSAISAAQARQMSWTPVSVPVFVASSAQVKPVVNIPTGDGKTAYNPPDVRTFLYDETSGYYYDPATGLYYDGKTQYFLNSQTNQYMYWDASSSTYIAATQNQQNTDQPKLPNPPNATVDNTIIKENEEKKKKDKDDKVKVAKKIAKDMERWARTLNQKKENARNNVVMEQPLDTAASKGSADIGFSVLGSGPSLSHHVLREISPPPKPITGDDFLLKKVPETIPAAPIDNDDGIIDWQKLTCLLCKRRFPTFDVLNKHKTMSDLHKQNLVEFQKKNELLPQANGYRDRAAERRMKFGEDDTPIRKRYEPPEVMPPPVQSHPPPSVVDTIGGKMLQKMGWSAGRGLGKDEQGRTAPIEAEQRPSLAGLGQKRGIYTPTPGETYRDTVKKLMIARYKEVVGQEDGNN